MKKTLKTIACQMAMFAVVSLAIGLSQAAVSQANQSLFAVPTSNSTTIDRTIEGVVYSVIDRSRSGDIFTGDPIFGYTGNDFTGYYIGTIDAIDGKAANNSETDMQNLISYYLDTPIGDLGFDFEKIDNPDTTGDNVDVTYDADKKSGTWQTKGGQIPLFVNFYAVKGSTEFALYWVDPAASAGDWITDHLLTPGRVGNIPDMSHITVNFVPGEEPPPFEVPEPMAMLLFGSSLVGLAGTRRRMENQ